VSVSFIRDVVVELDALKSRRYRTTRGVPLTFSRISRFEVKGVMKASNWVGAVKAKLRATARGEKLLEEEYDIASTLIPVSGERRIDKSYTVNFTLPEEVRGTVELELEATATIGYIKLTLEEAALITQ